MIVSTGRELSLGDTGITNTQLHLMLYSNENINKNIA
jgi:hypothetical protein